MLFRVVIRARRAQSIGQVVVATTTDAGDDAVADFCTATGFPCFRGDPYDVLDRYYQAACLFKAQVVVRLTGDCPLIDPFEIDRTVRAFDKAGVDFAANRLPPPWERSTPIGMDTEVVSFNALQRAWREAEETYTREHVMPYFYEEQGRFKVALADHDPDLGYLRLTVDTAEDLDLVRRIYAFFGNTDDFTLKDILSLFDQHPELLAINAGVAHKNYKDVDQRRS
jgi:spore coat polysaccharide biosynthesis protein SpsF